MNKTSERHYLEHNHETDLILLYDETGKILEFDIGNIMIGEGMTYTLQLIIRTFYLDV